MADEQKRNHSRVVDLDRGERPENSYYTAVKIYGKVYEPTKVERQLLKLYNRQHRGTLDDLRRLANTVYTRQREDWRQFRRIVYAYEAYGKVYGNIFQLGNSCAALVQFARAWDNLTIDTEPPKHWTADEMALHDKQRHTIAQNLYDNGVEYYAAALCASQHWFDAHGLQPYMAPYPFRGELHRLWDAMECLDTLLRRWQPLELEQRPPFNWDIAKMQVHEDVEKYYFYTMNKAKQDLEPILKI